MPEPTSSPAPGAATTTEDRARDSVEGTSTDAPSGDGGTSSRRSTSAADPDASATTSSSAGGSGNGSSRTRASERTEPSATAIATTRAPRTRERSGSSSSRSPGPTTRPAPLNIAPFNVVTGESWNTLEQRFRDTIANACGSHGPTCVTLAVVVGDDPTFFVPDDCVLRDVDQPERAFTGDTITVYIEDECGDGDPAPRMDAPDLSGLEGPSWAEAEPLLAQRITAACGAFGPGCLTVTTVVEADPAGPGAVDCAVRFIRIPTYLHADDRPQTPEPDDVVEVVLNDPCGPG